MEESAIGMTSVDKREALKAMMLPIGINKVGFTVDKTKWNECISIPGIIFMIDGWLRDLDADDDIRLLFQTVALLFTDKSLKVGPGISFQNIEGKHFRKTFPEAIKLAKPGTEIHFSLDVWLPTHWF